MANEKNQFNKVENWGLKCFEFRENKSGNSVTLKCALNGKKKEDGTYPKPLYLDVLCQFGSCDIPEDDYNNSYINVDGNISISDYKTKDGNVVMRPTIFATKVRKREFNN